MTLLEKTGSKNAIKEVASDFLSQHNYQQPVLLVRDVVAGDF